LKRTELTDQIRAKRSYLCVGLDTDAEKLPAHLPKTPEGILTFNQNIIEATAPYAVAYKINTAFYEQYGAEGWELMEQTLKHIPSNIFTIADAKRGDIGNTSTMYARAFLQRLNFHSITVSPYMGRDSIEPFLEIPDRWIIVLGLTSNPGSADVQSLKVGDRFVYELVMDAVSSWSSPEQLMFVVGATKSEKFSAIRKQLPEHFFLVPGVGAQGGDLNSLSERGLTQDGALLVNSSRGIIYASSGEDFAQAAAAEALSLQQQMEVQLNRIHLI
jgi:orotidine-5'-phosphate decarboxylase